MGYLSTVAAPRTIKNPSEITYVLAYGSNLDEKQMAERCPTAKPVAVCDVPNYALTFVGYSTGWDGAVATLVPSKGGKVPCVIWACDAKALKALDRYEGYPSFYRRVDFLKTKFGNVQAYLCNSTKIGSPSKEYIAKIAAAYRGLGFDVAILTQAVNAAKAGVLPSAPSAAPTGNATSTSKATKAKLLDTFKKQVEPVWHVGLGAAHMLLLAEVCNGDIPEGISKDLDAGVRGVLAPCAKRFLTDYFESQGGYYGHMTPTPVMGLWEQKTQGLDALFEHTAQIKCRGRTAVKAKLWLVDLDAARKKMRAFKPFFAQLDKALPGLTFAATKRESAGRQIEWLLSGERTAQEQMAEMRHLQEKPAQAKAVEAKPPQAKRAQAKSEINDPVYEEDGTIQSNEMYNLWELNPKTLTWLLDSGPDKGSTFIKTSDQLGFSDTAEQYCIVPQFGDPNKSSKCKPQNAKLLGEIKAAGAHWRDASINNARGIIAGNCKGVAEADARLVEYFRRTKGHIGYTRPTPVDAMGIWQQRVQDLDELYKQFSTVQCAVPSAVKKVDEYKPHILAARNTKECIERLRVARDKARAYKPVYERLAQALPGVLFADTADESVEKQIEKVLLGRRTPQEQTRMMKSVNKVNK